MSSCETCGITLRSDNCSGICWDRSKPACVAERRRREALRPGAVTGPRCLCSHAERDHPGGECIRWCGCTEWRLDARSPLPAVSDEDEIAPTGTDG